MHPTIRAYLAAGLKTPEQMLEHARTRGKTAYLHVAQALYEGDQTRPNTTAMVIVPGEPPGKNLTAFIRNLVPNRTKVIVVSQQGSLGRGGFEKLLRASMPDVEKKLRIVDGGRSVADAVQSAQRNRHYSPSQALEVYADPQLAKNFTQEVSNGRLDFDASVIRAVPTEIPTDDVEGIRQAIEREDVDAMHRVLDPHLFSDATSLQTYKDVLRGGQAAPGQREHIERLHEDSRGNIVRLLGIDRRWADFFQGRAGKLAFPFAKLLKTIADANGNDVFSHPPPPGQEESTADQVIEGDGVVMTFTSLDEILEYVNYPQFKVILNSNRRLTPKEVRDAMTAATEYKFRNQDNRIGSPFLKVSDGSEWYHLTSEEFFSLSEPLAGCGDSGGMDMYVLFDPKGQPHIAAGLDGPVLDQVAGIGNSYPKSKYHPAIDALAQKLGVKKIRLGVTGGVDPTRVVRPGFTQASVQREFLTDIAPSRELGIQKLDAILRRELGDHFADLEYLGSGRNGSAYRTPDGLIVKVTTDPIEAESAAVLVGRQCEYIHHIHAVNQIDENIWVILQEGGLEKLPAEYCEEFDLAMEIIEVIGAGHALRMGDSQGVFDVMARSGHADLCILVAEVMRKFDVGGMLREVRELGLSADFHSGNIMLREGRPVLTDLGTPGDDPGEQKSHPPSDMQVHEAGVQAAPQAGPRSQMRGSNSSAWAGGRLVLSKPEQHVPEDENATEDDFRLDQDIVGGGLDWGKGLVGRGY